MAIVDARPSADGGRVLMLASVVDTDEAALCLGGGADVIDCKDPSRGALGAVPEATARAIVEFVGGRVPVSATIGDMPSDIGVILDAALRMAATGVDYVKIGLPIRGASGVVQALHNHRSSFGKARLVGVLFADADPDFGLLKDMARAGFSGAVLDTADKTAGGLPQVMKSERLQGFVDAARGSGLFCGLAGSLKPRDIPMLVRLAPDLLGFRGALCREYKRTASIDAAAVAGIRSAVDKEQRSGSEPIAVRIDQLVHEERPR